MSATCLLLRPEPKLTATLTYLRSQGVHAEGLAVQRIVEDRAVAQLLTEALSEAPDDLILIVTSTYAVTPLLVAAEQKQMRPGWQVIAVGEATAQRLRSAGISVIVPESANSEGILALPQLKDIQGKSIWLCKGQGGRDLLPAKLTQRQALLRQFNLYQRIGLDVKDELKNWKKQPPECIIVTSTEQIEAFLAQSELDWVRQVPWIVVSERQKAFLTDKHIEQVVIAPSADENDLLVTIKQHVLEQPIMAENKNTQDKTSSSSQPAKDTKTVDTPKRNTTSEQPSQTVNRATPVWVKGLTLLNFLILLLILGAAGWGWWQGQGWWQAYLDDNQQRVEQQVDQKLVQQLNRQQGQLERLSEQLTANINDSLQGFDSTLEQMVEQNDVTRQRLLELAGRQPSDWMLAEADYLVRMAGRKLWLEHDVNTAIAMLQQADNRLSELNDPSLLPARQAVADDIQTLRLINDVPLTQLAMQLGALSRQVSGLSLAMVDLPEAQEAAEIQAPDQNLDNWQANLKAFWHQVADDFITIRRREELVKPLISTQQQWLLKEQLRLYLLQAQVAVMQEQSAPYDNALQSAQQLLQDNFDTGSQGVVQLANALDTLRGTDFTRNYPEQLSSAAVLKRLSQQRLQQPEADAL